MSFERESFVKILKENKLIQYGFDRLDSNIKQLIRCDPIYDSA